MQAGGWACVRACVSAVGVGAGIVRSGQMQWTRSCWCGTVRVAAIVQCMHENNTRARFTQATRLHASTACTDEPLQLLVPWAAWCHPRGSRFTCGLRGLATMDMHAPLTLACYSRSRPHACVRPRPQAGTAPLLTLLWAALGARGELEPRLAELMAALLRDVAPGSADELFWALAARDTAEVGGLLRGRCSCVTARASNALKVCRGVIVCGTLVVGSVSVWSGVLGGQGASISVGPVNRGAVHVFGVPCYWRARRVY